MPNQLEGQTAAELPQHLPNADLVLEGFGTPQ
jgi:hypothetical protein